MKRPVYSFAFFFSSDLSHCFLRNLSVTFRAIVKIARQGMLLHGANFPNKLYSITSTCDEECENTYIRRKN